MAMTTTEARQLKVLIRQYALTYAAYCWDERTPDDVLSKAHTAAHAALHDEIDRLAGILMPPAVEDILEKGDHLRTWGDRASTPPHPGGSAVLPLSKETKHV